MSLCQQRLLDFLVECKFSLWMTRRMVWAVTRIDEDWLYQFVASVAVSTAPVRINLTISHSLLLERHLGLPPLFLSKSNPLFNLIRRTAVWLIPNKLATFLRLWPSKRWKTTLSSTSFENGFMVINLFSELKQSVQIGASLESIQWMLCIQGGVCKWALAMNV
jgi:hypothetical protein